MQPITTFLAAAGVLTVLATAVPAQAQWHDWRHHGWHERHWRYWERPYVYAPPPVYYGPPRYYAPPPVRYGYPVY